LIDHDVPLCLMRFFEACGFRHALYVSIYVRTSSATNVGEDKDSDKRQRIVISGFAKVFGYEVVAEYADEGVRGADLVGQRPGFVAMLKHLASNGVYSPG
jgi:DNA invertase Pin-like site-specific DNA recombinase